MPSDFIPKRRADAERATADSGRVQMCGMVRVSGGVAEAPTHRAVTVAELYARIQELEDALEYVGRIAKATRSVLKAAAAAPAPPDVPERY